MSKIAIFSDLHLHPFTAFAGISEDGLNTRLVDIAKVLEEILSHAENQGCAAVLFCGDFFHTRNIHVQTLDTAAKVIHKTDIPIYAISGNHDQNDGIGQLHSLRSLKGRIRILDFYEGNKEEVAGYSVLGIPYQGSRDALLGHMEGKPDIMLLHTGFNGALMGADFIADDGSYLAEEDLHDKAGVVFTGHFHQPQLFSGKEVALPTSKYMRGKVIHGKTVLVPGAPLQHGFGDEGSIRGMWIYDGNTLEFNQIQSPKFMRLTEDQLDPKLVEGNYVTLVVDKMDARGAIDRKGLAKGVELSLKPANNKHEVRLDVSPDMGYKTVLERYIAKAGADAPSLMPIGEEIMRQANENS